MANEEQKRRYNKAKKELDRAVEEESCAKRAVESLQQTHSAKNSQVSQYKNDKINLEKRLQQVIQILSLLDSSVPSSISGINNAANTAGKSFRSAMRCSGIASASLETVFHTKKVEEDTHTARALSNCRAEKNRIETEIARLAASIKNLEEEINSLLRSINTQNTRIEELNRSMKTYQHDLNAYRQYIYK